MTATPFQRDNHYLPRMYLDGFTGPNEKIAIYRLLVSHSNVHLWKSCSIRGIAYYAYLYTRITAGGLSDDFEKWMEHEVETPAAPALRAALADDQLSSDDWQHLIRFVVAQDLRTLPASAKVYNGGKQPYRRFWMKLYENRSSDWKMPKKSGAPLLLAPNDSNSFPIRVSKEIDPNKEFVTLQAKLFAGRDLWLFSIQQTLTHLTDALLELRWTIVAPPTGLTWFTSDNPVIRLNYYSPGNYDFKGGWGKPGTEILFPLSPHHLLYTRVGDRSLPRRGKALSHSHALMVRQFIAEHAYRIILAKSPDDEAVKLRPRTVDQALHHVEAEKWRKWHDEQTAATQKLMNWQKYGTT